MAQHYLTPNDMAALLTIVPNEECGSVGHLTRVDGLQDHIRESTPEERAKLQMLGASDQSMIAEYHPEDVENEIVILYAGAAAELMFDPSRRRAVRAGARSDDAKARDLLRLYLGRPDREAELRQRAKTLVAAHWHDITVLATALLHQKWFDGAVAECILDIANKADIPSAARGVVLNLGRVKARKLLSRLGIHVTFDKAKG